MLKIYGSELCPDCIECRKNLDLYHVEYDYIDINLNLRDLKVFLMMRDSDPVFDHSKQVHDIGIPALIKEDGTILLDWEDYLRQLGHEPVSSEEGQTCSIDGKGC